MGKRNDCSTPRSGTAKAIDPKAAPVDRAAPITTVVFCGDPVQIRRGFALALQLMGIDAPVPDDDECDQPRQGS